ncbi:VWA domain-containing protein [bacterium]|nr:VWA domain-containing protein [bacterium]MBU1916479.1 VWA domain-containing protein [bacterium]
MQNAFFQFHSPWYFLLVIVAIGLLVFDIHKLHALKFKISSVKLVKRGQRSIRYYLEFVAPLIRFVALILLIVGLARPQWGNEYQEISSEGIDIVLALDTSGSMSALDLRLEGKTTNRLEVIKSVVSEFIDGRAYDRMGMVIFGTEAYTQCPLTLDHEILKGYLDLIEIGIVGEATAIGNALATSVKRLLDSKAKSKIIVLLTDGDNTAGKISPLAAAELAKEHDIKVYTIAVGRRGAVPMPVQTPFGVRVISQELKLDEESLQKISSITNGEYYRADSTTALKDIYDTIDKLEKSEVQVEEFTEYKEMYLAFVIPGILLLLLAWILQRTIFLRIP